MPLIVHTVYSGMGGIADVVFRLIEASEGSNYYHAIAFYGTVPLEPSYETYCNANGICYKYFKRSSKIDLRVNKTLLKWFQSLSPDFIFVHLPRTLTPAVKYRDQRDLCCIPVIGIEHNSNALKRSIDWYDSKRLLNHTSAMVYLTESYKQQIAEKFPALIKSKTTRVIPNGINIENFSLKTSLENSSTLQLGMCGRLARDKNIERLLEMVAQIKMKQPALKIQLSLAGSGEHEQKLKRHCSILKIEENVDFRGFLNEQELIQWFHTLDIYTHSSTAETLSTSIMQAMSCGLPVLAHDLPGMSSLISQRKNGILVKENTTENWIVETIPVLTNSELRNTLGRAARITIEKYFSHTSCWNSYRTLVEEIRDSSQ